MILVVGGVAAGKRAFARQVLGYGEENIAVARLDERLVVCDVQELLRQEAGETLLPQLLKKQVVICNEVGCGIVPIDPEERQWREAVGRLCCALAKEATAVVRLCCGVPVVLKGEV